MNNNDIINFFEIEFHQSKTLVTSGLNPRVTNEC